MIDELIYTSAPRGLRSGSSGFCTVAATAGLGPAWIERLEALSGYTSPYPAGHPREGQNPVLLSHTRLTIAGQTRSLLSRIAMAGVDHTGRANKIAHHLLLDDADRAVGGPAWPMRQAGVMRTSWEASEPQVLPPRGDLPGDSPPQRPAPTWQRWTGDAGWAGVLAEHGPRQTVHLIVSPEVDALALIDEAIHVLPPTQQWDVTFHTCYSELPVGVRCAWRVLYAGTPAARLARGVVLDLAAIQDQAPKPSRFVDAARAGVAVVEDAPAARAKVVAPPPTVDVQPAAAPQRGIVSSEVPSVARPIAVEEAQGRGIGFWLLAVGVPLAVCLGAVLVLIFIASGSAR